MKLIGIDCHVKTIVKHYEKISKFCSLAVIYLVNRFPEHAGDLDFYIKGRIDIIESNSTEKQLLNSVNRYLKLDKLNSFTTENSSLNNFDELRGKRNAEAEALDKKLLQKRTEQLSHEIEEHIYTKVELQNHFIDLESEQWRLSELVETMPNPIFIKNEELKYVNCNKAFEKFLGKARNDILTKTTFDFTLPDIAESINKRDINLLKNKKPQKYETLYHMPDGTIRNIMVYKNMIHLPGANKIGIIGAIADITEIKRANEILNLEYTISYITSLKKGLKYVFQKILDHLCTLYWIDACGIYLVDKNSGGLNLISQRGLSKGFIKAVKSYDKDSFQFQFLSKKENIYINTGNWTPELKILIEKEGISNLAILPLVNNETNELIGSLNLVSKKYNQISDQDKKNIEEIIARITNLILYAQIQKKIEKTYAELEKRVANRTSELNHAVVQLREEIQYHKKTKIALEESEVFYKTIFNNSRTGIILYDAESFKLMDINKAMLNMLGFSKSEFLTINPDEFVKDISREKRREMTKQLLDTKYKLTFTTRLLKKDKSPIHVQVDATVNRIRNRIYIMGMVQDITELVLKEDKLKKSKEKYRSLQDNIPVGIFSTNLQGNLLHVNDYAVKMFGYSSFSNMMKFNVQDLYVNKNKRDKLIKTLIQKGRLDREEIKFLRKDNSTFWSSLSVRTIYDDNKNVVQFDGIIEDISDLKKAETDLRRANKKIVSINENLENRISEALRKQEEQHTLLIQKSKLESLGELAAGIAHEINQPLGIMALTFENLQAKINAGTTKPDYLKSKFQSIENNILRIRNIINHIRIFSREQDSFDLEKVHVNKVIIRALTLIDVQYRNHNINIKLDLQQSIGFSVGSNIKLEQVVLNLLSNSKYALDEKGIFENETEFKKEILIKTKATLKNIYIMIEDNGCGIKADHLSKIFDPFFTTKPEGYGTGLGLSIVYGIIKNMHGDISVKSKEKKYTKFKILLRRFPEKD